MVSAWASANRLVLGQRKVDDKSNARRSQRWSVQSQAGDHWQWVANGKLPVVARGADYVLALQGGWSQFQQAKAAEFEGVAHSVTRHKPQQVIIDPHPENKCAIRCYEKVGFVYYATELKENGESCIYDEIELSA